MIHSAKKVPVTQQLVERISEIEAISLVKKHAPLVFNLSCNFLSLTREEKKGEG